MPSASQRCVCVHRSFSLDALPRFSTITCLHLTPISFYSVKARIDASTNLPVPNSSWTGNQWPRMELQGGVGGRVWSIVTWVFAFHSLLQHLKCCNATNQRQHKNKYTGNTAGFPLLFACVDSPIPTTENPGSCSHLHQHANDLSPSFHSAHRNLGNLIFLWGLHVSLRSS